MSKAGRIGFYLAAGANLLVAFVVAAFLWIVWSVESLAVPESLTFLQDWSSERTFGATLAAWASVWVLSLAVYRFSFRVGEKRRPAVGLYLIAMAPVAPGASIALATTPDLGSGAVAWTVGLLLALPALIFLIELVLGFSALGLAGLFSQIGAPRVSRRLYGLTCLFQPGNISALRQQGFAEYQSGAFARARPIFERLYEAGETNRRILEILETCYREEQNWAKDVECLDRLLELRPNDATLLRRLAEACERLDWLGRAMEARKAFLDPRNERQLTELARLAVRLKRWDAAVEFIRRVRDLEGRPFANSTELYRALLHENPECVEAMEDMAALFARMEAEPKAAAIWERILEIDATRAEARRKLADYLRKSGNPEKEEQHLRILASMAETDPETDLRLADNLIEQKRSAEAKEALRSALSRHPSDFRFPHALCLHCLVEGDLGGAADYLARAEAAAGENDLTRLSALRRRLAQEKVKRELAELRAQARQRPEDIETRFCLVDRLAAIGQSGEARLEFDALLAARPDSRPQVLAYLDQLIQSIEQNFLLLDYKADLLFQERDYSGALATCEAMARQSIHGVETLAQGCEKILRARPDFEPALARLGAIMMEGGRWERVIEIYGRLVDLRGKCSPETAWPLLEANSALGRYEEAWKRGLIILEHEPENLELRQRLADLCAKMERYQEGLELLDEALKRRPGHAAVKRAHQLLMAKRKRQRIEELRREVAGQPQNVQAHLELAALHQEFEELDLAITHYQKAALNESLHNLATGRLAYCLALRGMYDLAEETLSEVRLQTDGGAEQEELKNLIYQTALLFEENDLHERARAFYKSIFRVDASFRDVVQRIGRFG